MEPCRIYLIAPRHIDLETFPSQLQEAMKGGDVAALLIDCSVEDDHALQKIAEILTPIAQKNDVAVLLRGDSRIAGRAKCDGLHLDPDNAAQIRQSVEELSDRFMLGAEAGNKKHSAMEMGESGVDYIMFGRLDASASPILHEKAFELADWWSSLFEVPAVLVGSSDLACCELVAKAEIEFIALREAIWDYEHGPQAAVQKACLLLSACGRE